MKQKAIEWAEYVLPIFEEKFPEDDRPRKAIEAAKTGSKVANAATTSAAYAAADAAFYAADAAAAYTADANANATASLAAYAAAYTADANANATASLAAYASDASDAAFYAVRAIVLENYKGDDSMKRVNLIWTKKEQLNIAEKTKWLNYKPTDVWTVLLDSWTEGEV